MSPSSTCFFQIITNSAFQEGKLKFPNKYVHEHGNELYDNARLSIPTGRCWDVRVKREDDGTIWLQNGFLEFMKDNSIGIEYFLIFTHEGNSKFVVYIFDLTATEIKYNYKSGSERCNVVNESNYKDSDDGEYDSFKDESGDKDSDYCTDDSSKNESGYEVFADDIDDSFKYEILDEGDDDSRKYRSDDKDTDDSSTECPDSTRDHLLRQVFAEPSEFASMDKQNASVPQKSTRAGRCYLTKKKRQIIEGSLDTTGIMHKPAIHATNQSVIKAKQSRNYGSIISSSDIPKGICTPAKKMQPMVPNSFRVSMRPYNITKGLLRIPCAFARSHMCCSTTLIKLVDADNKEWDVLYLDKDSNSFFLSKGWLRFAQHKGLMVGDICVFERIGSSEEMKLKVKHYMNLKMRRLITLNRSNSESCQDFFKRTTNKINSANYIKFYDYMICSKFVSFLSSMQTTSL